MEEDDGLGTPLWYLIVGSGTDSSPLGSPTSAAKPTLGGCSRKTEYTFLRNVAPTIQLGVFVPAGISKNAPTHWISPAVPRSFSKKSSGEIAQNLPPKLMLTVVLEVHGIE